MKPILLTLCAAGAALAGLSQARGQITTIVDNLGETPSESQALVESDDWYAQGFATPSGASYILNTIILKLLRGDFYTGSGTFSVSLWDSTGTTPQPGEPGPPVRAIATDIPVMSVGTALNDVIFTAPVGLTLSPSTTYFVVLSCTDPLVTSGLFWSFTDSPAKTAGVGELGSWTQSYDQGANWEFLTSSSTGALQLEVTATVVPEPQLCASLCGLALLAFAALRASRNRSA